MMPGKADKNGQGLPDTGDCFVGLDLGSTAIKGVVVSGAGQIVGSGSTAIQRMPSADSACFEIDPDAFIESIYGLIAQLASQAGKIRGISWVAASGNVLLLNDKNRPLAPMISWLDERPLDGSIEKELSLIDTDQLYRTVGWPLSHQFPFGRLLWLKKNNPEMLAHCARICTGNDWLGYRLTGNWAIDRSTGTTMYVYDQVASRKHEHNLSRLGLSPDLFADLFESGTVFGKILPEVCASIGIDGGPEAVLGSFDHPGAARALGIHSVDQLLLSCGTSWVGLVVLPDRETGLNAGLLLDPYESARGGNWCGMFSLTGIGKRIDSWFDAIFDFGWKVSPELKGDQLAGKAIAGSQKFELMNRLAGAVDPFEPTPETELTSLKPDEPTILSMLTEFGPGAVFRGLMESTAYEFRRMLAERWPLSDSMREMSMVGGPANSMIWRQIVADTMNRPITVRFASHAGAVGAAMMAARGTGYELEIQEQGIQVQPDARIALLMDKRFKRFMKRTV
jgi:xylulokinase